MEKRIRLKDGRMLGFSQYGDPKGKPMFYFHGWPVSRLSGEYYDATAKKLHIRIISPDRPGFGLSDYQQNRTLLDWPDDVEAITNHLHIKKFAVMGVSGGGPYAAVCAYKIPQRLTRVGIVVGLAPIVGKEILDGMLWVSKIGWANFGKSQLVRKISVLLQMWTARYGKKFELYRFSWGKEDIKILHDTNQGHRLYISANEAFRSGTDGPEHDLLLYTTDWGFDLTKIKTKTYLWYGQRDRNVSINMAKFYKRKIKKSVLKIYPGEGHLISITHADEILKTLTK